MRDYLSPVLRDSKFKETGRITPDEFVAAGDFLVYKFPTWRWEAGEPGKARDFLPKDKQYLISRNGAFSAFSPLEDYALTRRRASVSRPGSPRSPSLSARCDNSALPFLCLAHYCQFPACDASRSSASKAARTTSMQRRSCISRLSSTRAKSLLAMLETSG